MRIPRPDRPPLRRSHGQHHLRDGAICAPLVDFLALEPATTVLEIGAGGGVLTRALLARGARVVALELDPAWAFELAARLAGTPGTARCRLVVGDALEIDWSRLPTAWRVAGNLPYNVGTAIVERLLRGAPAGVRAAFLLQREVVERMVARPGDDAFGALSLRVAMRARALRLGVVRAGSFVPPPKVESAFVGLESVAPPLPPAALAGLDRLIQVAFAQRRKSLRNALAAGYGRELAEAALAAAGIAFGQRAEELGLDEFLTLREGLEAASGSR